MVSQVNSIDINGSYLKNNPINVKNGKSTVVQQPAYQKNLPQQDIVEISKPEQNGLSKKAKTTIAIGVIVGLAVSAIGLYKRYKPVKLSEHIDFSPAKTAEEALNFTKKQLGIKKVDKEVSSNLDVMNWINEGLVKVNNAAKGKALMPKKIGVMTSNTEKNIAGMRASSRELYVNMDWTKNIDEKLLKASKGILSESTKANFRDVLVNYDNIMAALEKFTNKQLSFNEKIALYEQLQSLGEFVLNIRDPKVIAGVLKSSGIEITKNGKTYKNANELAQLFKEIPEKERVASFCMALQDSGIKILKDCRTHCFPLLHEMGHSEHYRNVGSAKYNAMFDAEKFKKAGLTVSNITQDFINSEEKQSLAQIVSHYAKTSPLEFVAEAYSKLVDGITLPKDVMELYNFYGGPKIGA